MIGAEYLEISLSFAAVDNFLPWQAKGMLPTSFFTYCILPQVDQVDMTVFCIWDRVNIYGFWRLQIVPLAKVKLTTMDLDIGLGD
jgi:hypothetical protein